jgi:hypothetical protein
VEKQTRGRNAPLLVSRAFRRIALPLVYHALIFHSLHRSSTLSARPVRTRALPSPSAEDSAEDTAVFRMLGRVEVPSVTLPNSDAGAVEDPAGAIQSLRGLCALAICKGVGPYPCSMRLRTQ